jgi:hypothetical protein
LDTGIELLNPWVPLFLFQFWFDVPTFGHRREQTALYQLIQQHAATFLAQAQDHAAPVTVSQVKPNSSARR